MTNDERVSRADVTHLLSLYGEYMRSDVPDQFMRICQSYLALLDEREWYRAKVEAADNLANEIQDVWRTTDIGVDRFPWDRIGARFHEYQVVSAALAQPGEHDTSEHPADVSQARGGE